MFAQQLLARSSYHIGHSIWIILHSIHFLSQVPTPLQKLNQNRFFQYFFLSTHALKMASVLSNVFSNSERNTGPFQLKRNAAREDGLAKG